MARDSGARVHVERGIYLQPNGKYVVCFMVDGSRGFARSDATLMAASAFATLLEPTPDGPQPGRVVALPKRNQAAQLSARERAALR